MKYLIDNLKGVAEKALKLLLDGARKHLYAVFMELPSLADSHDGHEHLAWKIAGFCVGLVFSAYYEQRQTEQNRTTADKTGKH